MQNQKKSYLGNVAQDTITMTAADRRFAENIVDLSALMETIASNDGQMPHVNKMKFWIDILVQPSSGVQHAIARPCVVQTAGTFTDVVDRADFNVQSILAAAIDDEYGFQWIQDSKISRLVTMTDDTGVEYHKHMRFTIDLPKNIINLLNREVSTERLQELKLALVGACISANAVLTVNTFYWVDYVSKNKGITIR